MKTPETDKSLTDEILELTANLEKLKPAGWHFCDILVRREGKDFVYQGDWLKELWRLRQRLLSQAASTPLPCGCHCKGGCSDPYAPCARACDVHMGF